ncbi:unnamed protein product [Mytilus edulis]|uniref:Uncharacterized protein n=1 Tax=Mytilus edulis TaxID=6550 RepID=A0A8S3SI21_MYTED|nr:unnamed protein product [Mytilus edulis]
MQNECGFISQPDITDFWNLDSIGITDQSENPDDEKPIQSIAEIKKQENVKFEFIPTNENPADVSTRGTSTNKLAIHRLWWHGPVWLNCAEGSWKFIFKETETEIELLTNAVKEKEMLACELQKENNDLNKGLRQKQAKIEKLSQQFREWSMASTVCLFCAAIDIGTTYTRVAFSSRDDSKRQAPLISTMIWPGSKLLSFKAPTAVLLDSNQKFVAFGYEAENMYSELVAYKEHEEYYYFHRFKMLLCDRVSIKFENLRFKNDQCVFSEDRFWA